MTKGASLEELINAPDAAIAKIKLDKHSAFLTGVTHYPNLPPTHSVAQVYPRVSYRHGTMLFVAIPYLGQEPQSSASFRKGPPIPIPGNNPRHRRVAAAEKLTAYPIVGGNGQPASSSSLSLFQYKFPLQSDTTVFDKQQTVFDTEEWHPAGGATEGENLVVHQILFMVFDDGLFLVLVSCSFRCNLNCSPCLQRRLQRSGLPMMSGPSMSPCFRHTAKAWGRITHSLI